MEKDYYLISALTTENTIETLTVCDSLRNAQIFCHCYEPIPVVKEIWIEEGKMNGGFHTEIPGTRRVYSDPADQPSSQYLQEYKF